MNQTSGDKIIKLRFDLALKVNIEILKTIIDLHIIDSRMSELFR